MTAEPSKTPHTQHVNRNNRKSPRSIVFVACLVAVTALAITAGVLMYSNRRLARANDALAYNIDRYCGSFVTDIEIARDEYRRQLEVITQPNLPPDQLNRAQAQFDHGPSNLGSDLSDAGRAAIRASMQARYSFCSGVRDLDQTRGAELDRRFAAVLYQFGGLPGSIHSDDDRQKLVKALDGLVVIAREVNQAALRSTRP